MLRCSHVVCRVADIEVAVRDFTDLGFTVEWGSDPKRADNALIWFAEGPFIELLRPPPPAMRWPLTALYGRAVAGRIARWARSGEGWCDVALETDATELAPTRAALQAAGVDVSRIVKGKRTRPDGQPVRYEFLAPAPPRLPFVVSAYDPPQRPAHVAHANGALALTCVRLRVSDADRARYELLAGEDRWLRPEAAAETGVRAVELSGLRDELDPARLHGAVVARAAPLL
jgi:catechol 2,3-dioxygenase-like lactoylglutathione lyase family enzyme